MSLPGSRRWWVGVGLYVVALFAVQPYLGFGVDAFKERWGEAALDRTVMVVAIAAGLAVAGISGRLWRRATAGERWVLAVALLFYGLGVMTLEVPQERLHYAEFGLLAGLVYMGLAGAGMDRLRALAIAALAAAALGFLDERLQGWFWERRYFDWRDVELNARASLLGVIVTGVLDAVARRDAIS